MDTSEGIFYEPLCPKEIGDITTSNLALNKPYRIYDLIDKNKYNLQIRGYVDYYGGYAEHTRNVIFGLDDTGKYNIKLTAIKTPVDVDPLVWQKANWFIKNKSVDIDKSVLMTIAGPGWLQKKFLSKNRKNIGWTMIECLNFNEECSNWIKNVDYLFCPTDTDIERAKRAGSKNMIKVHLGYDHTKYHKDVEPMNFTNIGEDTVVFGVLGSWNIRKGVKEIIRAYCEQFSKKDDVCLMLVCKYGTRPFGPQKERKKIWTIEHEFNEFIKSLNMNEKNLPHIALLDLPIHENVLPHVMARFNCLVGFSSGESTWLPGLQAFGMNIPVIQLRSDCSGFTEYMNHQNSYLCVDVKYEKASEEFYKGTSEYYKDQCFAFGSVEELGDKMAVVYDDILKDSEELNTRLNNALYSSSFWTWKHSIEMLDRILSNIL